MIKILFVCHGNICRSPMAEFVMKNIVKKNGKDKNFFIESRATSAEEIGNPVYPAVREKLKEHGMDCTGKVACQLRRTDYMQYDYFIGMDQANLKNMIRIFGGDPDQKIHLLMDYTDHPRDIMDPWYTRDFEKAWQDIQEGCQGFFRFILQKIL